MKAIILCSEKEEKMFPFDKKYQLNSLPILNKELILWQIEQLLKIGISESNIYVFLGHRSDQTRNIIKEHNNIHCIDPSRKLETFLRENLDLFDEGTLLLKGNYFADFKDLESILYSESNTSVLLTKKQQQSVDMIGADVSNNQVNKFLGHAREHYVNSEVAGIFKLSKEALRSISLSEYGFNKRVTGSMIPNCLFVENGLNDYIDKGHMIEAIFAQNSIHCLQFPWDIMKVNAYYLNLATKNNKETHVGENSRISEDAFINGSVVLGKNSYVGKNVIINGPVIIGNNVTIDSGAILNGPILIGNDTYVKEYAKIKPNTVIGNENRIGHNAEIEGVTMTGISAIHYCEMYGVIGQYVDIAAACVCGVLRFNDTQQEHRINGRNYSGSYSNAVFIGDFTRTGVNNIFFPGVKVGSECALYPGLSIEEDISHEKLVIKTQEYIEKEWGYKKYGW